MLGNKDRAADVIPKLVETEWCGLTIKCRIRIVIARPLISIESRVTEVLISSTVKIAGTALCGDTDLATRSAAILSVVVGSQDLYFLRRVSVRHAKTGAVCPGTHSNSAVLCNQGVLSTRSIHIQTITLSKTKSPNSSVAADARF